MVYALDAKTGKIKWEREATQEHAVRRPPPQEHLCVGDAVHRRRAALRVVRPERRPVRLRARRHAALEEAVAAAADLSRLRHRVIADRSRRPRLPAARQRGRFLPHRARCEDRRRALAHAAPAHRPAEVVVDDAVRVEEREADRDRDARPRMVLSYGLDGKELWRVTGMSMPTASPLASDGWLYVGSGSQGDANRPFLAIKPGASGDITLADGAASNDLIALRHPRASGYTPSALVHDGRAYLVHDTGILAVLEREDRPAALQGPRRRRRSHVLRLAGCRGQPHLLPDGGGADVRARGGRQHTRKSRRTISTRCRSHRRQSRAARSTSARRRSCTRSARQTSGSGLQSSSRA